MDEDDDDEDDWLDVDLLTVDEDDEDDWLDVDRLTVDDDEDDEDDSPPTTQLTVMRTKSILAVRVGMASLSATILTPKSTSLSSVSSTLAQPQSVGL